MGKGKKWKEKDVLVMEKEWSESDQHPSENGLIIFWNKFLSQAFFLGKNSRDTVKWLGINGELG